MRTWRCLLCVLFVLLLSGYGGAVECSAFSEDADTYSNIGDVGSVLSLDDGELYDSNPIRGASKDYALGKNESDSYDLCWRIIQDNVDPNIFLKDSMDEEMSKEELDILSSVANNAVIGCNSDYEKIQAICKYAAEYLYYDFDYIDEKDTSYWSTRPYDVYINRRTVCDGYSFFSKNLLSRLGIPCMVLSGNYHVYNCAYDRQNEEWIFFDSTWCSGNAIRDGEWIDGILNMGFFDTPIEDIKKLKNHEVLCIEGIYDGTDTSAYYTLYTGFPFAWNYDEYCNWGEDRSTWKLIISGGKDRNVKSVRELYGISVVGIDDYAFAYNKNIRSVDLSRSNISKLGRSVFIKDTKLGIVSLPDSVSVIGVSAFQGCKSLKSIDLSKTSIKKIGKEAFYGCSSLSRVSLPKNITEIKPSTFSNCKSLKIINLSKSKIKIIGSCAFSGCSSLGMVKWPKSIKSIKQEAFRGTAFKSVTIPSSMKSVGNSAFIKCKKLKSARVKSKRTKVAVGAFPNSAKVKRNK